MDGERDDLLADSYGTRGWLSTRTHRFSDAVRDYRSTLEICLRTLGSTSPVTGWTYVILGNALASDDDLDGGINTIWQGLSVLGSAQATNDVNYAAGELAYSKLLKRVGRSAEAAEWDADAKRNLAVLQKSRCSTCTIDIWTLLHD